jgi:hypothetical protein
MNSIEIRACVDMVIDPAVEALQVMGTRDVGDATGVMFVKLLSAWDAGRFMMKFSDVKFRGHEIKVQYASKEFPMERMYQVKEGMLGHNKAIQEREVQRWVNRRNTESREQAYGEGVVAQFAPGQELEFNDKGERVFNRGHNNEYVMKLGVTEDSKLMEKYPLQGPAGNVVVLPIGGPVMAMREDKGKGEVKGKGKGKEEDNYASIFEDLPGLGVTENQRRCQRDYGLCPRCGNVGHNVHGVRAGQCQLLANVNCRRCGRVGHHYKACRLLGFSLDRQLCADKELCQEVHGS